MTKSIQAVLLTAVASGALCAGAGTGPGGDLFADRPGFGSLGARR